MEARGRQSRHGAFARLSCPKATWRPKYKCTPTQYSKGSWCRPAVPVPAETPQ